MQFDKGQYVVYGTKGMCIIDDIAPMKFSMGAEEEMYYVLKQVRDSKTKVFVPVNNDNLTAKLREPMNKDAVDEMVIGTRGKEIKWTTDRRSRNDQFRKILAEGVGSDLLLMIRCIVNQRANLDKEGKKLPVTDLTVLKTAERLVDEEFSNALEIKPEAVGNYIMSLLGIADGKI